MSDSRDVGQSNSHVYTRNHCSRKCTQPTGRESTTKSQEKGRGWVTLIPSVPHGNSIPLTSERLSAQRHNSGQMRLEGKFLGSSEKEKEMCSWANFVPLEHVKLRPGA